MEPRASNQRTLWLVVGLLAGLSIAFLWPHEPAQATAVDRAEQFAIFTCPVSVLDGLEAIFTLDLLTGRLEGRVLNPSIGIFTHTYVRNVGADFNVERPQLAVLGAQAQLPSVGNVSMAAGVIYVAEMKTGQVVCYGFPYNQTNRPIPPLEMLVIGNFQFRAPAP